MLGAVSQKVGILNVFSMKIEAIENIILSIQGRLKNMSKSTEFKVFL